MSTKTLHFKENRAERCSHTSREDLQSSNSTTIGIEMEPRNHAMIKLSSRTQYSYLGFEVFAEEEEDSLADFKNLGGTSYSRSMNFCNQWP